MWIQAFIIIYKTHTLTSHLTLSYCKFNFITHLKLFMSYAAAFVFSFSLLHCHATYCSSVQLKTKTSLSVRFYLSKKKTLHSGKWEIEMQFQQSAKITVNTKHFAFSSEQTFRSSQLKQLHWRVKDFWAERSGKEKKKWPFQPLIKHTSESGSSSFLFCTRMRGCG